jgi:hypothetical protein
LGDLTLGTNTGSVIAYFETDVMKTICSANFYTSLSSLLLLLPHK